jgi:uncharacterized protein (DUF1330 family)
VKSSYKFSIAILAGILAGAAADRATPGQQVKPAPVYVISEADTITDSAAIQNYGAKVGETFAPFEGHYRFLARGKAESLDGGAPPEGIVVIEFDSSEDAHAWYNSPAYAAIRPIRLAASKGRMFIVQGIAP